MWVLEKSTFLFDFMPNLLTEKACSIDIEFIYNLVNALIYR